MKEFIRKIVSFITAGVIMGASTMFSSFSPSATSTAPDVALATSSSNTRSYYKHICGTTTTTIYTLTQDELSNSASPNAIYGEVDSRVLDYKNTAVVRLDSPGGTGFIVGDHTIATCAHCVHRENAFVDDMVISIVDDKNEVIKQVLPKVFHVPCEAIDNADLEYDFAMIEVDEDLSEYGCFAFGTMMDDFIYSDISRNVYVSGFPVIENIAWGKRYIGEGSIETELTSESVKHIYHTVDTSGGNSGGPLYCTYTSKYGKTYTTVIGINHLSMGTSTDENHINLSPNRAIRIRQEHLQFYLYNTSKNYDKPA